MNFIKKGLAKTKTKIFGDEEGLSDNDEGMEKRGTNFDLAASDQGDEDQREYAAMFGGSPTGTVGSDRDIAARLVGAAVDNVITADALVGRVVGEYSSKTAPSAARQLLTRERNNLDKRRPHTHGGNVSGSRSKSPPRGQLRSRRSKKELDQGLRELQRDASDPQTSNLIDLHCFSTDNPVYNKFKQGIAYFPTHKVNTVDAFGRLIGAENWNKRHVRNKCFVF